MCFVPSIVQLKIIIKLTEVIFQTFLILILNKTHNRIGTRDSLFESTLGFKVTPDFIRNLKVAYWQTYKGELRKVSGLMERKCSLEI